jgi:hypothetical protein
MPDGAIMDSLSRISDLVLVGEFKEASAIAKNLEQQLVEHGCWKPHR